MRATSIIRHCCFLYCLLGLSFLRVFAQTAQVTGTVADPTGSVMPAAKITATNIDTGVSRSSVTNDAGNYLITALLPGKYRIVAEAAGFK
jgi:Carboxypeptidase regulatory-like domain